MTMCEAMRVSISEAIDGRQWKKYRSNEKTDRKQNLKEEVKRESDETKQRFKV